MRSHQSSKGSILMQILQYIFFSIVCIWLLYLMRHSFYMSNDYNTHTHIENNCEEEVLIKKVLGRKADAGSSCNVKDSSLIESDQWNLKLDASNDNESNEDMLNQTSLESAAQGEDQGVQSDHVDAGESESNADSEENKLDTLQDEGDERLSSEKQENDVDEEGSLILLKSGETLKLVQFTEKNGISVYGSSPSRRSDIQVESCPKGSIFSGGRNQSRESQVSKRAHEREHGMSKFQKKTGDEKAPEKSRKGSRREILELADK